MKDKKSLALMRTEQHASWRKKIRAAGGTFKVMCLPTAEIAEQVINYRNSLVADYDKANQKEPHAQDETRSKPLV